MLETADLDGNGTADLILNIFDGVNQTSTISVCLNPLSGATWWTMPSPGFASWPGGRFYVTDISGDGQLDLVGTENYFTGTPPFYPNIVHHARLSVAVGTGNGQFQAPVFFELPTSVWSGIVSATAVGDFDGDRDPDLIFYHNTTSNLGVARNRSRFGNPNGGGGLYSPLISSGLAIAGNSQFSISVSGMPAGAPGLLGLSLGANPPSSPVLIDFSPSKLILPAGPFGFLSTDTQGQASLQIPIPASPSLSGAVVFGQWGVADPQSSGGIVLSGGATFIIQ